MATSAYTRARGQRASQMSRQSQSAGRCPAVHRCTLLGQHFHYAHLHCFLMDWLVKSEVKEILLAPTKQVSSRLYRRGCFKVIFFPLLLLLLFSIKYLSSTPTVRHYSKFHTEQIGNQPTYCLQLTSPVPLFRATIFCENIWSWNLSYTAQRKLI